MYQIIGIERNEKRVIIATPSKPGEALTHFRAAQNLFPSVLIMDGDGQEIDGFELSRRYAAEQRAISD